MLACFGSGFITRALKRLERAAYQAAEGHINEDVPLPKSDDEIRGLSLAFNKMLHNMRSVLQSIEANFHVTNEQVTQITQASSGAAIQAEAISITVQEIFRGADQSAVSIQETAAVEDIIEFATQVQDKADSSEKLSNEMVSSLTESKKEYDSLITAIQTLARKTKHR